MEVHARAALTVGAAYAAWALVAAMYVYLMLAAGAATLALAIYAWFQGRRPSNRSFAALMAAIALWVTCIAGWSLSPSPSAAMGWFRLQFLGVTTAPVLLLFYTLNLAGRSSILAYRRLFLLWLVPLITVVVAWSPLFHRLLFLQVDFVADRGYLVLQAWVAGPWFLLHSSYSFSLVAISLVLLVRAAVRSRGIFRRQLATLLLALTPAIGLTFLNTFQLLPPDELAVPLGFLLTGTAVVWSILRDQLISVVPVARDLLIEQMDDGMLVLDEQDRLIDLNPAMQALLGRPQRQLLGLTVDQALGELPALRDAIHQAAAGHAEVDLCGPAGAQQYDVGVRALRSGPRPIGRLIVLHNISRLKQAQAELFTLATTDALTGLCNRRQFFALARRQIDLAARKHTPLAVLLLDLDHFKAINDQQGHEAGDYVLTAVAQCLLRVVRSSDLLCRYGGEEFTALLPDTEAVEAERVAERLREALAAESIAVPGKVLYVTVSIGVAVHDGAATADLDQLLRQADEAMYQAKRAGHNRVIRYR